MEYFKEYFGFSFMDKLNSIPQEARIIIFIFMLFFTAYRMRNFIAAWTTKRIVKVTITHKERVFYPGKFKSMYLVYTDTEVFRNEDSLAFWNFNSSDLYGKLEKGGNYELKVYGFLFRGKRIKAISDYRNIVKATKID